MVARSRPSARRSNLRDDPKTSESKSPVTEERAPADVPGALRSKRGRISSISDAQSLSKRLKVDKHHALSKIKFPLRSRRQEDAAKPKPVILTKPVFLAASHQPLHVPSTSITNEPPTVRNQPNTTKLLQKRPITSQEQPQVATQDDKRKLRSKDGGSRSKSELALFFNNYEQMLSLEPTKPDVLTSKTRITLVDDLPESPPSNGLLSSKYDPFGASKPLYNTRVLDLTAQTAGLRRHTLDPLSADVYYKAHRKEERKEKSARNVERERAQHEKAQLDRLLEELKGHDWLKTMGISGVTESEKKLYEPKRVLFIREVAALIEKFKNWKEKEKEQKKRKEEEEVAMREAEEENHVEDEAADEAEDEDAEPLAQHSSVRSLSHYDSGADYSSHEVDALAAKQLHQETTFMAQGPKKKSGIETLATPVQPPLLPLHMPFKSFYSKRHLRDAAVAGHRRSRTVTAFGEPVPELEDTDFELPDAILTEDAVRASSRRKRRLKRESVDEK